jgi:hypothetical protein
MSGPVRGRFAVDSGALERLSSCPEEGTLVNEAPA